MIEEFETMAEEEKITYAKRVLSDLGFQIDPEWGCLQKNFEYLGWYYRISFGFSLYDGTMDNSGIGKFWFWGKSSGHKIRPEERIAEIPDEIESEDKKLYNQYGIEPVKKTKFDRYSHLVLRCGREEQFEKVVNELKDIFNKRDDPQVEQVDQVKSGKKVMIKELTGQLNLFDTEA